METYEKERDKGNNVSVWVPILLVPVLFIAGWAANDLFEMNTDTDTQFGVGGAPGNFGETPTSTPDPFDVVPTDTPAPTISGPTSTGPLLMDESPTTTDTDRTY